MTDAMQTIRDALEAWMLIKHTHDEGCHPSSNRHTHKCHQTQSAIGKTRNALTALDSLAVTPSEDASKLARDIRRLSLGRHVDYMYIEEDLQAAAIIQAHDDRIRGQCSETCPHRKLGSLFNVCTYAPEATDGQ